MATLRPFNSAGLVGRLGAGLSGSTGLALGGAAALPLPPAGSVRLRAVNYLALGLVAELGGLDDDNTDVAATRTQTVDATARRGMVALTEVSGTNAGGLVLPLLLDRWAEGASIETELRVLERMAGMDAAYPEPVLRVEGVGLPAIAGTVGRWVVDGDLAWGEKRRLDGTLVFAQVTVTLTQLTRPMPVSAPDASQRVTFRVPAGTRLRTLQQIARAHAVTWKQLRDINPALPGDPDKKLPEGTRVRVA